jgi:Zn-dependent protease/CBS domain-containing protein
MKLGRLFGIEIHIDLSWLFVFALVTWSLSSSVGPFHTIAANPGTRTLLGILTALLFFASILLHELAHSLAARARGIPIESITLFIFGGVSRFQGEATTALSAAWIAFIGPLTSLVLGLFFLSLGNVLQKQTIVGAVAGYLGFANIAIACFNLIPAFPMDGGRVLHALLWGILKDRVRATRAAVRVGCLFAWLMILLGIFQTLFANINGGLWITLIGWFLLQAGKAEGLQSEISTALKGHHVAELAEPVTQTLAPNIVGTEAMEIMRSCNLRALPIILGNQLLGIITISDLAKIPTETLGATFVTALMTRREALKSITPDTNADDVLRILVESGHQQLPILDATGDFHGFVTTQGILRWVAADREKILKHISGKP